VIRPLAITEIESFVAHSERQMLENGQGATLRFSLRPPDVVEQGGRLQRLLEIGLSAKVGAPSWCRVWIDDGPPEIRGHVGLRAHLQAASAHRALVSVGVLEPYRRLGVALHLMQTAIAWATNHGEIAWPDSEIFGHNHPALNLHTRLGFVETGRVPDLFRLEGRPVDDVRLVLRLPGAG
jgi:GNAT superfamily N-acetyltransferase